LYKTLSSAKAIKHPKTELYRMVYGKDMTDRNHEKSSGRITDMMTDIRTRDL
jgi:hypothetical protein